MHGSIRRLTYPISTKGDSGCLFVTPLREGEPLFYSVVAQLFFCGIRRSDTLTLTWAHAYAEISVVTPAKRILEWLRDVMGEEMEFVEDLSD